MDLATESLEPEYVCEDCYLIFCRSDALKHHHEKGHKIRKLSGEKDLFDKPLTTS